MMTGLTGRTSNPLLRHDAMIVVNELRATFSSWSDRLIALVGVAIALAALNSSLSHRPLAMAATIVLAVAAVIGAGMARIIRRRLDFHACDGVIAADALAHRTRHRYGLSIHMVACGTVTIGTLVGRPETVLLAPAGYLAGAGSYHLARRLVLGEGVARRPTVLRPVRALLRRPISGALAAVLVVLPLLLVRTMETGPLVASIGLLSVIAALLLTIVDDGTVRFMTLSGYRAGRIIGLHARSLLVFVLPTVPACLILSHDLPAIVVAGVVAAALVLMTVRILAYRIHSKRTADTVVGICAAVACLAGFATPMLVPVVVIAILWHLHRRSVPATWMLA